MNIRDRAIDFLHLAASGNVREAFAKHVANGFIHHNAFFAGDAKSLMLAMEENAANNPAKIFEVQRSVLEDNLVAVHSKVRMRAEHLGVAVVHIFRFENNQIVELWDIGQPVPESSPNRNGMF